MSDLTDVPPGGYEVAVPDVMYVAPSVDTTAIEAQGWVEDGTERFEGVPHRVFRRPTAT